MVPQMMPGQVADDLMRVLRDARPHEFSFVVVDRAPCITVRGWRLLPFCDGGDLDYIDRVEGPDGTAYDVDATTNEDGDAWVGSLDGRPAVGEVFNWSPPAGAIRSWDRCPCDHLSCWADRRA